MAITRALGIVAAGVFGLCLASAPLAVADEEGSDESQEKGEMSAEEQTGMEVEEEGLEENVVSESTTPENETVK